MILKNWKEGLILKYSEQQRQQQVICVELFLFVVKNGIPKDDATYQALGDALKDELVQHQDLAEKFCYTNGNYVL